MVIRKNKKGFTLVEILVAMAIFSIVAGLAIGIFVMAMRSQRKVLAQQQLLDQVSYLEEYMSRAIRMAQKEDSTALCITPNSNYATTSDPGILFKNYNGNCQKFYLDTVHHQLREFKNGVDLPLTASSSLMVNSFKIKDSGWDQADNLQPAVIIFLDITGKEGAKIQIQTTISQRNLDVQY